MIKTFWNNLFAQRPGAMVKGARNFDPDKVRLLLSYFPIGAKPRYYPEYRREIVFHTIILGYRINEQFLYSREACITDDEGLPKAFLMPDHSSLPFEKVGKIQILIPNTTEMEKKLDYLTRAEIGRAGQFGIGNSITLVANNIGRGIPTIDTRVDRRQTMPSGPYAGTETIIVTPDLSTLELMDTDNRRKQRVKANSQVLVSLYLNAHEAPYSCRLADLSDTALRLNTVSGNVMPAMGQNEALNMEFNFGDVASSYRLSGRVFRREDDFCVVNIERIYRDGGFDTIKSMDIMAIKSELLNMNG